jgi:hypothetical protein
MIRLIARALAAAANLFVVTVERSTLPDHDPFVNLPFRRGERVVALEHHAVGHVIHHHVDPEQIEDIYVISTDDANTLVVPEGGLRSVRPSHWKDLNSVQSRFTT